jgi:hypothetical protein
MRFENQVLNECLEVEIQGRAASAADPSDGQAHTYPKTASQNQVRHQDVSRARTMEVLSISSNVEDQRRHAA